jgi:alkylation response protein AidB-like acyl-CoA dehydrogenase
MRDSVQKFAKERISPLVSTMDQNSRTDSNLIKELFENGLMGIEIPEKYGGVGGDFTTACMCIQEIAKVDPSVAAGVDVHNTVVNNTILKWGSSDLKERLLGGLANEHFGSFCLTEAKSGSDAFALETSAKLRSDGSYELNGTKMWISNAEHAGVFLVFANANPEKKHKGITCFAVEKHSEGLEIGKKEDKLGIRSSSTCQVHLDSVVVPPENIVGQVGEGYKYAIEILNEGRIGIAAQMVGLAQGAFEQTMPYLYQRKQFNQEIGNFQAMQVQYARVAMEIAAAELLVYHAAKLKENNKDFVAEAAMTKLKASEVAEKTASLCIEWMGGMGFSKEAGIEKFYRDAKIGAIYEGTSNIQLLTIAKKIKETYA